MFSSGFGFLAPQPDKVQSKDLERAFQHAQAEEASVIHVLRCGALIEAR